MLSVSLAPAPFSTTGGAPAPTAALALPAGLNGQTIQAAPPAIGAPITGNQRRPGQEAASTTLPESAPAIAGPNGLQPAALGNVRRSFGDSTAFLTQLIDQTNSVRNPTIATTLPPSSATPEVAKTLLPVSAETLSTSASAVPVNPNVPVSVEQAVLRAPVSVAPETQKAEGLPEKPMPRAKSGQGAYYASQQRLLSATPKREEGFEPVDAVG